MWHMTRQAEEDGFWVDCFVHERKHQLTKDAPNHVKNTQSLELTVLTNILNCTLEQLKLVGGSCLMPPCTDSPELSAATGSPCKVANEMRYELQYIHRGDLMFAGSSACMVEACVQRGEELAVLARSLVLIDRPSQTTSRWKLGSIGLLDLSNACRPAACWYEANDGTVVALS